MHSSYARTLHSNDILAARRSPDELRSRLDCLGARVPKEERIERRIGHDWRERLDELEPLVMERNAALERDVRSRPKITTACVRSHRD